MFRARLVGVQAHAFCHDHGWFYKHPPMKVGQTQTSNAECVSLKAFADCVDQKNVVVLILLFRRQRY